MNVFVKIYSIKCVHIQNFNHVKKPTDSHCIKYFETTMLYSIFIVSKQALKNIATYLQFYSTHFVFYTDYIFV